MSASALDLNALLGTSFGGMTLGKILSALLTLIVCLIVIKAILKLANRLLSRSKLDARVRKYIHTGVKMILYVIAAIIVVGSLGIDMTSLVAPLSLVNALLVAVSRKKNDDLAHTFQTLEGIWDEYGVYEKVQE